MARGRDTEGQDAAADAALAWFTRLQSEAATESDWRAFETWLAAAPEHATAYERLEALWVELDDVAKPLAAALAPAASGSFPTSAFSRRRREVGSPRSFSRRAALLTGGALAAGLAVGVVSLGDWPESSETHATAPGETRTVRLADHSLVWLNAGSRIDVRFSRHARHVEMADGEAVFDVAHDPRRPFLIAAGSHVVRVVGTKFNLRQRDSGFELSVLRGAVEVGTPGAVSPLRVRAGQRLVQAAGSDHALLSSDGVDAADAWTRGLLIYRDAPLSRVAADLTRSLGRPVRIADAVTEGRRFTGILVLDTPDAVIGRLAVFADVRAERAADGGVLLHPQ